jgi:hypothetical protein
MWVMHAGWRSLKPRLLVFTLAAGLVACSGQTGSGRGQAVGDMAAYCDAVLEMETLAEPNTGFESLSPQEQVKAAMQFAATTLRPIVDKIVAVAPAEVGDSTSVLNNAVTKVEQTGELSAFDTPQAQQAKTSAHAFDLKHCGWGRADVTAVDYAFQGVPATMNAGTVSFEFRNKSQRGEHHEMVVFKKNEGVRESFQQLLMLPDEEAKTKATIVTGAKAPPGASSYGVAKLVPGDYAMVCFISVGSKKENPKGQGPPHFIHGMVTEFAVT